jgi:dihydrofolate reductase
MRKLIVLEHVSLDGVIQAPGAPEEDPDGGFRYGGWTAPYADDVVSAAVRRKLDTPFDLLLGRKTFDIWASYWPEHGDFWPGVNTATKYVASNTLTSSAWKPSVFLGGDVPAHIARLKKQQGPDLNVWGSGQLIQTLLRHDLVDVLWLMTFPVTLGSGKRLFADGTVPAAFKATGSIVSPAGVVIMSYERAGAIAVGRQGPA